MNPRLKKLGVQLMRYGASAGVVLVVKLAGVAIFTRFLHASIAYALVHVITVIVSYALHTRATFAAERSWKGFLEFLKAVIGAKILDYLVFNVAFAYFDVQALWSVAVATGVLFIFRFFMIRNALTGDPAKKKTAPTEPATSVPTSPPNPDAPTSHV